MKVGRYDLFQAWQSSDKEIVTTRIWSAKMHGKFEVLIISKGLKDEIVGLPWGKEIKHSRIAQIVSE